MGWKGDGREEREDPTVKEDEGGKRRGMCCG